MEMDLDAIIPLPGEFAACRTLTTQGWPGFLPLPASNPVGRVKYPHEIPERAAALGILF